MVFAFLAWAVPLLGFLSDSFVLWRESLGYSLIGLATIFSMARNKRLSLTVNGLFMGLATITSSYWFYFNVSLNIEFQTTQNFIIILLLLIVTFSAAISMFQCLFSKTVRMNFYRACQDNWLYYEIKEVLAFILAVALVLTFVFMGLLLAGPLGGLVSSVVCALGYWFFGKRNKQQNSTSPNSPKR